MEYEYLFVLKKICLHLDDPYHFYDVAPSHGPTSLMIVALSSSSIHLQWEPPPPQHHNGVIDSYTVHCTESDTEETLENITPTTNITISELHPFYTYTCSVAAVTVDQGPFSDIVSITTLEDGKPMHNNYTTLKITVVLSLHAVPSGRPFNLMVTAITPYNISLSWTKPEAAQRNGIIRYYLIYLTPVDSPSSSISRNTSSSSTSYTVTALHPHTSYQITVAAVTIAVGPNSTAELTRTEEDGRFYNNCICIQTNFSISVSLCSVPSAPPQDVSANPISPHDLSVTWRAPPHDKQNGEVRHYNIRVLEVATGNQTWYITSDSSAHFTVPSLHPHYVYRVSVAAATVGLGPFSQETTARMSEAGTGIY